MGNTVTKTPRQLGDGDGLKDIWAFHKQTRLYFMLMLPYGHLRSVYDIVAKQLLGHKYNIC